MSKYTVKEARAIADNPALLEQERYCINAYADRLEADEKAVTEECVGVVRTEGWRHFAYIPLSIPSGTKLYLATQPRVPDEDARDALRWRTLLTVADEVTGSSWVWQADDDEMTPLTERIDQAIATAAPQPDAAKE